MITIERAVLEDANIITEIKIAAFNKEINKGKGYGYYALHLVEKQYPLVKEWYLSTPVFSVGNQHLYEKFGYVEIARDEEEISYCKRIREHKNDN